jgi:hypothetical protein
MVNNARRNVLYCFSPPVMLATCVIEVSLVAYVWWRYKSTVEARLVSLILIFLATFQLAEYLICGAAPGSVQWARAGYIAITLLPPLGLHLITRLTKGNYYLLVMAAYGLAGGFILILARLTLTPVCCGNYTIFIFPHGFDHPYTAYYFSLLAVALIVAGRGLATAAPRATRALKALIAGYLIFIVPTGVVVFLDPALVGGIPSIMCGFAVAFALILVFGVLPYASKPTD